MNNEASTNNRMNLLADDDTPITVLFNGINYYVTSVFQFINQTQLEYQILFSLLLNSSSVGDLPMAKIVAYEKSIDDFTTWQPDSLQCRTINAMDAASTYAGCLSVIGSGFCAAATASTGVAAAFCTATWDYTLSTGAADCFNGIADALATQLGLDAQLKALQVLAQIDDPKLKEVLETSLGIMCTDVKNNAVAP